MKIIFITIGISFFTILNISAQSSNWEFTANFPANGFTSQFDSSGVHSLTVDGEGKIWFQLWELTSVTEINGQNTAISPIFVFNEDGSESEISPINLVVVGTDTTFFTETNARGMSTDNNGDIIASYGSKLFRLDHLTGQGLSEFLSPRSGSLTKPSVSNDGKIVVGHVFPDLPIYYLDEDLSIITNVVDSRTGFARTVEISEDGKEVFVFKHNENRIEVHSLDTLNSTFSYSRDILSGISAESSVINGDKLWVGGGHNSDDHVSSDFQKYTWYEFDLNTETITNQIKWNFSGSEVDLRPRGIAFSSDNKTTYLGQFFGDGESIIQKFEKNEADPLITIAEARTLENGTEVIVKGVVTRTSENFVYLQQDQAALMLFSNESSSPDFFTILQNDSLNAGDSLLVTGSLTEFEGLKEITDITEYSVISSGNPLPVSQEIALTEAINNAETYESEIVYIRDLEFIDGASGTFTSATRYVVQKAGTDTTYRFFVHGLGNSDMAGEPIPQTTFDYEGIIKEINDGQGGTHHVLAPHNPTDIVELEPPVEVDSLEITFKVDMSVQNEKGNFNPDSMAAQLAGNFTGWETPVDMQNTEAQNYQITYLFIDPVPGDTAFYKFAYTKNESIIYEDPNPEISEVATQFNNRFYVFTGVEEDLNEDGIKDVVLDRVFFSDNDGNEPIDSLINLSMQPVNAFITDTVIVPVQITGLSEVPMSSFEMTVNFDPSLIDVELSDESESITSEFLIESNYPSTGKLVISGATTTSVNSDGDLLYLTIYPQTSGTGFIDIESLTLNENDVLLYPAQSEVTIIERVCGDVTNDMTVSTLDATFVLRHTVFLSPQYPLSGLDSLAADVTGNGDISAFDASKILQYEVGFIDNLGCKPVAAKKEQLITKATWHKIEDENDVMVTIDISNTSFDVYSAQLQLDLEEGLSFSHIKEKPSNWQVLVNNRDGSTLISMFGVNPLQSKSLELVLTKDKTSLKAGINAEIVLNESEISKLSELVINTLPDKFSLNQNYPNPFNPSTNIEYSLPERTNVTLAVYNMLGQKVATLVNETLAAGSYTQTWDASSVSSGVYFYRLTAGNKTFTKRMLLVK